MNIKFKLTNIKLGDKFKIDGETYEVNDLVGNYIYLLPVLVDGSLGSSVDGLFKTKEELEEVA